MASDVYTELSPTRALDRTIARGMTWTAGIKAITIVLSWACTIALARILSPQDYGIVTMATVYVGLTAMVTDFGLASAIIALPDLGETLASQLHSAATLIGGAAFVVSCVMAVPISRFFRAPNVAPVIIALSTILLFDALRAVPTARLGREMRFKDLALLDGLKVLVAVAFSVALAVAGFGYWALVLGNVVAALFMTLTVLTCLPQRFARPRLADVGSTLKFSSHFLTGQLAWYGYSNADFVVAGRILGKIALGEYSLAWTIISAPGEKIMSIFGRVMPMVLANVQRDSQALRRYFLLFSEALAILIIPAAFGLALVAHDFVFIVFGTKWAAAVVPLQLLSIYMAFHILVTPADRLLQSTGRASFAARCGFLLVAVLPIAFYLAGRRWGTSGIAAMWVLVYPFLLIPLYSRAFRILGIHVVDYLKAIAPTAVSTLLMVLAVLATRVLSLSLSLAAHFAFEVGVGLAAFAAATLLLQRERIAVLAEFVRSIRK
jgi:O-antigen/teichoic acid export membrane protein